METIPAPSDLQTFVDEHGFVPLAWAGATTEMSYLNWGDALSPVMTALMCGLPIRRVPTAPIRIDLDRVGTIGHGFDLGSIHFWGTGSSQWMNPSAPRDQRLPVKRSAEARAVVHATRGPISERILGGSSGVYGDPVWLLPRFYQPETVKTHDLGIILHLSELNGRALDAGAKPDILRAQLPEAWTGRVRIINTLTAISPEGLKAKTDEILSCRRIVSTSLHGMVIAETYGIPCLYFAPRADDRKAQDGPVEVSLEADWLDLRIRDLYQGLGQTGLTIYAQRRDRRTDFDALLDAIDQHWRPLTPDVQPLMDAFPIQA
ncbi:MAG: polysaccharide pyruvyl transferase family protein, partial [Caulobacteraceae bacterium]